MQIVDGPLVDVVGKGPHSASAKYSMSGRGAVSGRGPKKGGGRSGLIPSAGRGRPTSKGLANSFERSAPVVPSRSWKASTPENGVKGLRHIQLPSLDALVKQVVHLYSTAIIRA